MMELDPEAQNPAGTARKKRTPAPVFFQRQELDIILSLYGQKVAAGEWRDYAMDGLKDEAVFSIFRRASEMPIYRIMKQPKLRLKQGQYSVVSATGQILKRGHDLRMVLRVLDKRKFSVID